MKLPTVVNFGNKILLLLSPIVISEADAPVLIFVAKFELALIFTLPVLPLTEAPPFILISPPVPVPLALPPCIVKLPPDTLLPPAFGPRKILPTGALVFSPLPIIMLALGAAIRKAVFVLVTPPPKRKIMSVLALPVPIKRFLA